MASASTSERWGAGLLSDLASVERILLLHRTDRWYVGDFLRHASWLRWAQQFLPGARVDLATHSAYLPLYGDGRFGSMVDVSAVVPADLSGYDLVIEPTSFPVLDVPASGIRRLLRTWDRGWALYVHGRPVAGGAKDELNYFRSAHPNSLGLPPAPEQDAGGLGTPLSFSDEERQAARLVLDGLFPGGRPILVYNPTASNPFTRETSAAKEVDNTLTVGEHSLVARQITLDITDHELLVAAPVKASDGRNTTVIRDVAVSVGCAAYTCSLREFAALLADPRVCSTVGGGTGSNTHLAALVGTWSLSIERGADARMRANWSQPNEFQMGSFRWRNPSTVTAVHTMSWDDSDDQATAARLAGAARAFVTHHRLAHGRQDELFERHHALSPASHQWSGTSGADLQLGQVLTAWMTPSAREHLADFTDELAYLRHRFPSAPQSDPSEGDPVPGFAALPNAADPTSTTDPTVRTLAEQLFRDSNLHKLVCLLTAPKGLGHAADRSQGASR